MSSHSASSSFLIRLILLSMEGKNDLFRFALFETSIVLAVDKAETVKKPLEIRAPAASSGTNARHSATRRQGLSRGRR